MYGAVVTHANGDSLVQGKFTHAPRVRNVAFLRVPCMESWVALEPCEHSGNGAIRRPVIDEYHIRRDCLLFIDRRKAAKRVLKSVPVQDNHTKIETIHAGYGFGASTRTIWPDCHSVQSAHVLSAAMASIATLFIATD